jgi:hypothetical protein
MTEERFFSVRRLWLLLRHDIVVYGKPLGIAAGAAAGVLLTIQMLAAGGGVAVGQRFYAVAFALFLSIAGTILTSLSFTDLHHPQKGCVYLTIPCSIEEKFFARVLLTSPGLVAVSLLFFFCYSFLGALCTSAVFSKTGALFNPLSRGITGSIQFYLLTHPVFFCGALYFRSNAWIKTVLTLVVVQIFLFVFTLTAGNAIVGGLFWNAVMVSIQTGQPGRVFGDITIAGDVLKWFFRLVFPVLMLAAGYFRLRETEL